MSGQFRHRPFLLTTVVLIAAACQAPSSDVTTSNKAVVREFFAALDVQDYTALTELMADDHVIHGADGVDRIGRDAAFELIRSFYRSFPDYTHDVVVMIAEGDRVATIVDYRGTHQGEFQGVAPTGRQVNYAGAFMMTVVDGSITESWFLDDDLNLLRQLGMELVLESSGN